MSSIEIPTYSITPYFLHVQGLVSSMDSAHKKKVEALMARSNSLDEFHRRLLVQKELTDYAIDSIRQQRIAPLEELLLNKQIKPGMLATFHRPAYFKGAPAAIEKERKGQKSYAEFHTKLSEFEDIQIRGRFSPEHFTCSSSTIRLSGRATRFVFAVVDQVKPKTVLLRPLIIGDRVYGDESEPIILHRKNGQRVNPEDIDEFAKLAPSNAQRWDTKLKLLKGIPEKDIKKMFAELLNEGNIPKDWGGETSDLFTTHIHLKGARASAAFLLKGPAKFHKLTVKDLGANGDQITRLFNEPADIHIVQHCHYITAAVLHHLDAFASRPYAASRYCILDGIDTLRILVGYGYI